MTSSPTELPTGPARAAGMAAAALLLLPVALLPACSDPSVDFDSYPIALSHAPGGLEGDAAPAGGLMVAAELEGTPGAFPMMVDTGTPITILRDTSGRRPQVDERSFRLLGGPGHPTALRATFRNVQMMSAPLSPTGEGDALVQPGGVLGADLLRWFSLRLTFGSAPEMTFWGGNQASDAFLSENAYAVLHYSVFGGGELDALGPPDLFGMRGPIELEPTRIMLRACAAPAAFTADASAAEQCCARGDETAPALVSGVDLQLLLATGVGPMVLGETAYARLQATGATSEVSGPATISHPGTAAPIPVRVWAMLPRLALVDLQAGTSRDPGACVELARARRLEQVDLKQLLAEQEGRETAACAAPCDSDPNQPTLAQDSAAYLELGTGLAVAVISDAEPLLQALRLEVRSRGPDVDGILGAEALRGTRLELDYQSDPGRAIFSCDDTALCRAVGRCSRLPNHASQHACFGNGWHRLPTTCEPDACL